MISFFTVENYRSFPDKTTIELRPLTLIFGYNNSGKSALLRFLPLLAESVSSSATAPLSLSGKAARGARFRDLRSKLTEKPAIFFQLEFDSMKGQSINSAAFRVRDLEQGSVRQVVEWFSLEVSPVNSQPRLLLEFEWIPEDSLVRQYKTALNSKQEQDPLVLDFEGLVPKARELNGTEKVISFLLARDLLQRIEKQLQWLTSFRVAPKRLASSVDQPPQRLTPEGENAAELLAYDKRTRGPLLPDVSSWYERHTGQSLDIDEIADAFSVTLGPKSNSPVRINIADTGEGMAQVLPVLVAAAIARHARTRGGILALEQPELHLHPNIHGALAEHFCELANSPEPPKTLIETHSENFLLEVQLQIVKQNISPDKVLVYWVRQDAEGRSSVARITFDEMGRPQGNWPPDVFREDIEKAREIVLERRKHEGI